MEPFLCGFMNEAVVLSDGRVTTCCMDPLALNCFANIYEDSFDDVARRHAENVRRVVDDAYALPRCKVCYDKIKAGGFKPGRYKVGFSEQEKQEFLERNTRLHQLVIEPSSICNLKCRGCMQSRFDIPAHRQASALDLDAMLRFLEDGLGQIEVIRFYNYGETFVNKGAIPFIAAVTEQNPALKLTVATNGLLLRDEETLRELVRSGISELVFSIHGSSQETVEPYMTKVFAFDSIMDMLRDLVRIRREEGRPELQLVWKHLLFEWNDKEEDVQRALDLAEDIGMDFVLFVVPGFPSPSKRFAANPELLDELNRNLSRKA